ncbi:MAG TPA: hydantoinase B/oxoprolinase family protein [Actinophytocola sp.]|jgi:N-methylhydantoinase B|nr:hydantoinase B/oxoprolinase family protein [Actinophytocola sp.]
MVTPQFRDPITFEVFKNALIGLADQMGLVMWRTSHSRAGMDFSTGLCDHLGRVLAQGNCLLLQVGSYSDVMTAVLRKFGDDIRPGDVYLFNDIDETAQHLPDHYMIKPCFDEDRLLGFGVSTTHHADVGGLRPGSMDMSATEIFQEGLQIPLVKLYDAGRRNDAVWDIMMRNSRFPGLYAGDLAGQLAGLSVAEAGLRKLALRYTPDGIVHLGQELIDYTERLSRTAIGSLPDGACEFVDMIDDDGVGFDPIPLKVRVEVSGEHIWVDWTGSAPQVPSAINCHIGTTRSVSYGVVYGIVLGVLGIDMPNNHGFYELVSVHAPEGTIVNPRRPAARAFRGPTHYRLIDALFGALQPIAPDLVPAAGDGGSGRWNLYGTHPVKGRFVDTLGVAGSGWGGRPGMDGADTGSAYGANTARRPVEEAESLQLIRIDRLGYVPDTGGPGRWRGSLAVRADLRLLVDEADLELRMTRRTVPPYGLAGGRDGTRSVTTVNPGPDEQVLPSHAVLHLKRGDLLRHVHSGGGGFGDPFLRDPQAVLEDVLDEKLTAEYARREYGVAIDTAGRRVDEELTAALRTGHST